MGVTSCPALEDTRPKTVRQVLAKFDRNCNKSLDLGEFRKVWSELTGTCSYPAAPLVALTQKVPALVAKLYEKSAGPSGKMSIESAAALMKRAIADAVPQKRVVSVESLILRCDNDKSGDLSLTEFHALYNQVHWIRKA